MILNRAPRQAEILQNLQAEPAELPREELRRRHGDCSAIIRALERKGWVEAISLACDQPGQANEKIESAPDLNGSQRQAVDEMVASDRGFRSFLLDGVTSSGKTEVYLALAARHLEAGRQVLILVPEIGLTPQLLRRIRRRLGAPIAVLHSGLSDGERQRAWLAAARGRARRQAVHQMPVCTRQGRKGFRWL